MSSQNFSIPSGPITSSSGPRRTKSTKCLIVNLLTLERIFLNMCDVSTCFYGSCSSIEEAGRNVAHVSKIRSKVSQFTINFYSWSHKQNISYNKTLVQQQKCSISISQNPATVWFFSPSSSLYIQFFSYRFLHKALYSKTLTKSYNVWY